VLNAQRKFGKHNGLHAYGIDINNQNLNQILDKMTLFQKEDWPINHIMLEKNFNHKRIFETVASLLEGEIFHRNIPAIIYSYEKTVSRYFGKFILLSES